MSRERTKRRWEREKMEARGLNEVANGRRTAPCRAISQRGYYCSLATGHAWPEHVAMAGEREVDRWDRGIRYE